MDVLVVGGGPAGRALAGACAGRGLATSLVDPAPDAPWRATYGSWATELPATLPASVIAAVARGAAVALTAWDLDRDYAVLDVAALRRHLDAGLADVDVRAGRVVGRSGPDSVRLADGGEIRARLLVDAGGSRRPLRPGGTPGVAAQQSAYGLVVDEVVAAPLVEPGSALFMDWRPDHGEPGPPTFLYAVPLGGGAVLLEETSLARRPALPMPVLRRRLLARLAAHGITPAPDARAERVLFPVDQPRHHTRGVLGFGAAAPLVHPATGFSVATALTAAPAVAAALAGPGDALAAAQAVLWPASAQAVHRIRRVGLEALLRMPPEQVPAFFETFLGLPARHRWAYLDGRTDLAGTLAAMGALFGRADNRLRLRLVGPAVLPPAPPAAG
ncbi:lycopene cyclase family protein [Pseudonocardia sp. GCM10023141]|uniref:lycopene cyclase family protein n=1 Tax=Pseudonocardia sp. GCM10023141 TaxID=3252653 RepID=UPI00361DA4B8